MKIENPNPIQWQFSERAQQLQSSAIREILKITQRPEIISFAGGLPSPATFPVDVMKAAYDKVLSASGLRTICPRRTARSCPSRS
jgi:2-aminoadipate transaminase